MPEVAPTISMTLPVSRPVRPSYWLDNLPSVSRCEGSREALARAGARQRRTAVNQVTGPRVRHGVRPDVPPIFCYLQP
jgi:hypothetical protein